MGDVTKNFSFYEYLIPHKSGKITNSDRLKVWYLNNINMQPMRSHMGKIVTINSGKRSPSYNKLKGGSPTSDHMFRGYSAAADFTIKIKGAPDHDLLISAFNWLRFNRAGCFGQLILYFDELNHVRFIHISLPTEKWINDVRVKFPDTKYLNYTGGSFRPKGI